MHFPTAALAVLLILAVAGCGGQNPAAAPPAKEAPPQAPQRVSLITTLAGDTVALDPASVAADGPDVSLTLYFTKKAVKNGVKTEVWQATFRPSERLLAIKTKRLLSETGQEISADTASGGWEYVAPAADSERIMFAVGDYCKRRGLPLDDTPPPYALPGFMYVAKSTANNAFYLYKPATVERAGNVTKVEVLMINQEVKNGVKYTLSSVTFKPAAKQYQTTAETLYDAKGKKLSAANDDKWYAVPANSVYDMLLDLIR